MVLVHDWVTRCVTEFEPPTATEVPDWRGPVLGGVPTGVPRMRRPRRACRGRSHGRIPRTTTLEEGRGL